MTHTPSPKKKSVKKNYTIGFETEFFILDKKTGYVAHGADEILKKVAASPGKEKGSIVKEVSKNLIELGSYPDADGANTMSNLMKGLKLLLYAADELGYAILPLGTYPGAFSPSIRPDPHYQTQQRLHGKSRFQISGRCAGYHCHYSLPWGVFDSKTLMLKSFGNSRNQESLVYAHNFLIAIDPALTTFMQSSPFYQGKYIAKDSRMVMYRGSQELGFPVKGLYTDFPRLGALPSYEHSGADLVHRIQNRYKDRIEAMVAAGITLEEMPKYKSILSTNWTPVKINPHGTLEQRGMDMNHLPLLLSASVLLWRVMYAIQEKGYKVVPHDLAKKEPFKLQGETIYVAPDSYIRETLQKVSAVKGLQSDEIFTYCRRLVDLVKKLDGKKVEWLLKPLEQMLEERQTTSDKILAQAKSLGYTDFTKVMPKNIAAEIAKTHSKQMFADIVLLEKMIEENAKLTD